MGWGWCDDVVGMCWGWFVEWYVCRNELGIIW